MKYLKEITDWSDNNHGYSVPNHTYLVEGEWCYGYVRTGTKEEVLFNTRKRFTKSRRRFVELKR